MPESFDLVVVGTGAAGSSPASRCRDAGWSVALVDDLPYGGTCVLRGCDPKRVLIGGAELVDWQRRMRAVGVDGNIRVDWPALMRFKRSFTDPVPSEREHAFESAGIVTLHGTARFVSQDRLIVTGADGRTRELAAAHVVIASGAEPVRLGIPGEEHIRTSTDFLALDTLPPRIAFIGAGYVSFEFAHLTQRAGAQAIVLGRGTPLGHFDQDLVQRLIAHSRSIGIELRTGADVTAVERSADGYRVHVTAGAGSEWVEADLVVHGAGRVPRTRHLDLDRADVATDSRGAVAVNEFLQSTSNPRVYAAGDCALPPGSLPLTPVATHEGRVVATNLLRGNTTTPDYRGTPSVVFTIPALATVGLTESDARRQGLAVQVKCGDAAEWYSNRRVREPAAMYKTIVDASSDHVLGAHLLGLEAPDVINVFALAIRHGITATQLARTIYAYPTSTSDVSYML